MCHEEGAATALLTRTSTGPVNWLKGIPALQCNGCECSDYLTGRRVDLGEMAFCWAARSNGNKPVGAADAVVTALPERLLFPPAFFFFSFSGGDEPFPGTGIEANFYHVLICVMCCFVTACWGELPGSHKARALLL